MKTEQQIREEIKRIEEIQQKADSDELRLGFSIGVTALKWVLEEGENTK